MVTLSEVPCRLYTLLAENGDPLLLFGEDEAGDVFWWPTRHISDHWFEYARWTFRNRPRWRGKRVHLMHEPAPKTVRWLTWLGVQLVQGEARI